MSLLPSGWEEMARPLGAMRRGRSFSSAAVLLRTLLVHLAAGCSLAETAVRVEELGWAKVSPVALFKRLMKAERWLRWIAQGLWADRRPSTSAPGRRLLTVDATVVKEAGQTGSQWRIHWVLDLTDLQCHHFELTDSSKGETFRRVPVRAGDLVMGDRGYSRPLGIEDIVGRGADVLVRVHRLSLPLTKADGGPLKLLASVRGLKVGIVLDRPAFVTGPQGPIAGRLVAIRRGEVATAKAREQLRRQVSRQQRKLRREDLALAAYVFVWTTLPAKEFTGQRVLDLYRMRWQIELVFKRMKSILGLGQLPKRSDPNARAWLHGKLLVALLLDRLHRQADAFSPWGYTLQEAPAEEPLAGDAVPLA